MPAKDKKENAHNNNIYVLLFLKKYHKTPIIIKKGEYGTIKIFGITILNKFLYPGNKDTTTNGTRMINRKSQK